MAPAVHSRPVRVRLPRWPLLTLLMLLSAWASTLPGCATLSRPWLAPEVSLRSLAPQEIGAERQTLLLGLRIDNPNDRPLPIRAMTYRLAVEGQELASGASTLERQIPANGSGDAQVSVNLDAAALARQLPTLALAGRPLRYRLSGTATVGLLPLPFQHSGEIDPQELLRAAMPR
ncbi:MAG: Water stress and hypersensitive response domain-containing protein [Chromatiaceae bacterium]|nr:MAG: Water stress and hypersensitive response domain-containing protein [Chromatiaceae bacterium]